MVSLTSKKLAECERVIEQTKESAFEFCRAVRTIRDDKLYLGTDKSFDAYCLRRWGWGRKRGDYLCRAASAKESRMLIEETTQEPVQKVVDRRCPKREHPNEPELVNQNTLTVMSARKDPERPCGWTDPQPPPTASTVRPPVSAALFNEIHAIVNYASQAQGKDDTLFHNPAFRHIVTMLKNLENRVQIILPGMETMFANDEKPRARATKQEFIAYAKERGLPESDGEFFYDNCLQTNWKTNGRATADVFAKFRTWQAQGFMPSQKRTQGNGGFGKPAEKHWSTKETEAELARLKADEVDFERRSAALRRSK